MTEVIQLLGKELKLDWKNGYGLGSVLLYVLTSIFIVNLAFKGDMSGTVFNALFWVITLFTTFNAINKSFLNETDQHRLYLYTLVKPEHIILSKIIYNGLLLVIVSFVSYLAFYFFFGKNLPPEILSTDYLLGVLVGSLGMAALLTLIAAIASQSNNGLGISVIMGFPVLLPFFLSLLKYGNGVLDGHSMAFNYPFLLAMLLLTVMVIALAYLLFPYIWRD